jgi:hypothetical protein
MKIRASLLLVLASLAGCASEIDQIKEGRMDAYPEFTVGQAFDNRNVCESTSWESFKDDRGRTIVEYRCQLVGVDAYYQKQADSKLHKLVSEQESWSGHGGWPSLIREAKAEIKMLEEKLASGTSNSPDAVAEDLAESREKLANYIRKSEAHAVEIEAKIDDLKTSMERIPEISGYEYFQWTILEDDTFLLVAGGVVESIPEGLPFAAQEYAYKNVHDPLSIVYANEVASYEM